MTIRMERIPNPGGRHASYVSVVARGRHPGKSTSAKQHWRLELECGHVLERNPSWLGIGLPPKSVRKCPFCEAEKAEGGSR